MFAKSSLFVFLAVALSATSVLASAGAGPDANAQVGRRFESDTPDYVSGSQSEELPHCNARIINVRGIKKVLRDNSHSCQKAAQEASADRQPDSEDDFGGPGENNDNGNIPDGVIGDNGAADEEEAEVRRPLLDDLDDEDNEEVEEEEQDEVNEAEVGSDDNDENRYTGGYDDDSEDEDEGAYAGQGHNQNI